MEMPNRAMPLQSWLSVDISRKISCTQSNHLADQLDLLITSIDSSHPSLVFVCVFYIRRTLCVSFCVCHGWLGARVIPAAGWIHAWALPLRPRARSGQGRKPGTSRGVDAGCRRLNSLTRCVGTHMEVGAAKGRRTFCTCSIFR